MTRQLPPEAIAWLAAAEADYRAAWDEWAATAGKPGGERTDDEKARWHTMNQRVDDLNDVRRCCQEWLTRKR